MKSISLNPLTPKQRMLNAYRGIPSDRPPAAPELWYYYPAKLLGLDMIEFAKVPFHRAIKNAFQHFGCEGWGVTFGGIPNPNVTSTSTEKWLDDETLETRGAIRTSKGTLTSAGRSSRAEPSWAIERLIKDLARDLPAWEEIAFGGEPENLDTAPMVKAWEEVGDAYLLEVWLGAPFFDFFACSREGGFEAAILDFADPDFVPYLKELQERFIDRMVRTARVLCEKTPFESLCLGCAWSCNSLIGPRMWRQWDKPVIQAITDEIHRHGKLLHIHFHGKCMDTVADFAEIGIDCVCPFERPPGGDVVGLDGLKKVASALKGRTCMNGNIHTVETLIRGQPDDVRREVAEVLEAFQGNPRVIVGTGDQVGRETPEENIVAMIEAVKAAGKTV